MLAVLSVKFPFIRRYPTASLRIIIILVAVEVAEEAKAKGETIHVGSMHGMVMEKGSELQVTDPERYYKGRVVFLGDDVRDQNGNVAVFEDMASSPASLVSRPEEPAAGNPGSVP